ncbi:Hypothetical predicted protein [Podarcis lilfordi]|uniref:Uncharacterized protein n=1 Tax=Podarcis lilfordi TaxID=74358 RepID=A0AA35JS44_9SAUR|nr:Hypothetical predicted protein [Podarcis lilfordi]
MAAEDWKNGTYSFTPTCEVSSDEMRKQPLANAAGYMGLFTANADEAKSHCTWTLQNVESQKGQSCEH